MGARNKMMLRATYRGARRAGDAVDTPQTGRAWRAVPAPLPAGPSRTLANTDTSLREGDNQTVSVLAPTHQSRVNMANR